MTCPTLMTRPTLASLRALLWATVIVAVIGCGGSGAPTQHGHNRAALAELERARGLHQEAERRAAAGDADGAVRLLEQVASLPFPPGAPEADDVAIDALAEASRVLLGAGRAGDAEAMARRALGRGQARPSYFRGLAFLRLGDAMQAGGKKRAAVEAFERSIAVNNAVLQGGGSAGPGSGPGSGVAPLPPSPLPDAQEGRP